MLLFVLVHPRATAAQVMARPGWAGSGVALEPWWQNAVFYQVDPARFQASGAEARGSLPGLSQRLDYLRALGVDAIILAPEQVPERVLPGRGASGQEARLNPEGLEDFIHDASLHGLRVLTTVPVPLAGGPRSSLLQAVREWMGAGAAGVYFARAASPIPPGSEAVYGDAVAAVGALLRSTPGDRVLLTAATPLPVPAAGNPSRGPGSSLRTSGRQMGRLATAAMLPVTLSFPAGGSSSTAGALRAALGSISRGSPAEIGGLLRFSDSPPTGSPDAIADATALLASRGAVLFRFGDEIGLDTERPETGGPATAGGGTPLPVMQWTPVNVQQAPIERVAPPAPPAPGQATPFGPYRPFVRPPPRSLTGTVPSGPPVGVDRDIPPPAPDPNTLPGYTQGPLPVEPEQGETVNVATEERDSRSVLSAYRALIALHHGNAALRDGAQILLNHDAEDALVFVRLPPPGSRTAGAVVVAANLGYTPVVLSLGTDLAHLGLHAGPLRALFSSGPRALTGESTGSLRLPAHAVFVGELVSAGRR